MSGSATHEDIASVERMLRRGPALQVMNFHHTPGNQADALERRFALVARNFASVDEDRLEAYCRTGRWRGRPGMLLAFYNGYASNFDVARPLLDRYGLTGWFFVASGLVSEPPETQVSFARRNRMSAGDVDAGPRLAMSWDDVRTLDAARHVVASHTRHHVEVEAGDADLLRDEIVGSQDDFRAALGHPVTAFAANRGGPYGQNPAADRLIREAGYRYVFSNLKIQRIDRAGAGAA